MRRTAQLLLLLLYVGQLLAPAIIITDFIVDRERIARELCVQRERTEGMRTCHGECHMMKQLHAAEHAAAQHTPPSLPIKAQPEWFVEVMDVAKQSDAVILQWLEASVGLHAGVRNVAEPVPWG
ncbi:MAG: hypothetical protein WAU70_01830 [Flavobacteriales bacterium]